MSGAYYNEHDKHAAAWLRELIKAGHIADGEVDERSIEDVLPSELAGFTQCHFFAGIGGWSLALRLAGWPDDRPVWTGSCPCQPFSAAGKGLGFADERHLWPAWFWLIEKRKPITVFGEQSADKDAITWLDLVQADMEAIGYAFGPIVLPAAGIGAPHGRHRTWFVADASGSECEAGSGRYFDEKRKIVKNRIDVDRYGTVNMGNSISPGLERLTGDGDHRDESGRIGAHEGGSIATPGPTNGFWRNAKWLPCSDGKARPTKSSLFPLAYGVSGRVGLLRGAGNAIVPEVAQAFIEAYLEAIA